MDSYSGVTLSVSDYLEVRNDSGLMSDPERLVLAWKNACSRAVATPTIAGSLDLGQKLLNQAQLDDAENILGDAWTRGESDSALLVAYAQVATDRKDWPEAEQRWTAVRERFADHLIGYIESARAARSCSRLDVAAAILTEAVSRFPISKTLKRRAELLREYAFIAMYQNSHSEAASRWCDYRSVFPENPDGYQFGARAYLQAGCLDLAKVTIQTGLEKFDSHAGITLELADLEIAHGNYSTARELLADVATRKSVSNVLKTRAIDRLYSIRVSQSSNKLAQYHEDHPDDLEIDTLDGPVLVTMSDEESVASLEAFGASTAEEMRRAFMNFESLGHSCEFGLVQRRYGAEPIGLLRWNSIRFGKLVQALNSNFDGMQDATNFTLVQVGREYVLRDHRYSTAGHTFCYVDGQSLDLGGSRELLHRQVRRMAFLRRKLIEDLKIGQKIFVHVDNAVREELEVIQLYQAVRSYGRATLLYVSIDSSPSKCGRVEVTADGFLRGYLPRQGKGDRGGWNIAFDSWLSVCREALVLTL